MPLQSIHLVKVTFLINQYPIPFASCSNSTLNFSRNNVYYYTIPTQLNSTQRASMDAGVKTPQCPHLSSHYCISILYNQLISHTDLSPIPVRSATKSYITSWCIQNLSKCVLNRQTVSTSTTKSGRLFQILTILAEKEYFRVS